MNKPESEVKAKDNVEYKAEGVVVKETEPPKIPRRQARVRRNILLPTEPKIYVNDGSNGTNLVHTYSYKNYADKNEKPSIENHYMNNFKSTITSNATYSAIDGLRLHPTADHDGWSNFTIPQFVRPKEAIKT